MKLYTLTNDHLFKKIFTDEKYLKILLKKFFNVATTKKITYLNPELMVNNKQGKAGIVDLLLEIDGEIVILELQNINEHNIEKRLLYYSSAVVCNHCLEVGGSYSNLKSIKVYAIINYSLFDDYDDDGIYLKRKNEIFNENLEYRIFDLTKIDENDEKSKYYELINLFKNNNLEELKEIIKEEEYKEILEKIENYNKNEEEYKKMEDIYEMMMNEKVDYESIYKGGLKAGYDQGMIAGISQGYATNSRNIAKNLLKQKVDINIISNATKLSIPEIKALR